MTMFITLISLQLKEQPTKIYSSSVTCGKPYLRLPAYSRLIHTTLLSSWCAWQYISPIQPKKVRADYSSSIASSTSAFATVERLSSRPEGVCISVILCIRALVVLFLLFFQLSCLLASPNSYSSRLDVSTMEGSCSRHGYGYDNSTTQIKANLSLVLSRMLIRPSRGISQCAPKYDRHALSKAKAR